VATIRYFLSNRAAKNIHASHNNISLASLVACCLLGVLVVGYIAEHAWTNRPYALIVETCMDFNNPLRPLSMFKVLPLQLPNLFNILSLLVDLFLIRFLRKNIRPHRCSINEGIAKGINSVSGLVVSGKSVYSNAKTIETLIVRVAFKFCIFLSKFDQKRLSFNVPIR
jgi:hypothetical protein